MIRALNELRNDMLEEQRDPGPVEDVLLKPLTPQPKIDKQSRKQIGMKPRSTKAGGPLACYAPGGWSR